MSRGPECAICKAPATCYGSYEGEGDPIYACDKCCGHDCEDGYCTPVAAEPPVAASPAKPTRQPVPWERDDLRAVNLRADAAHALWKQARRHGFTLRVLNLGQHWEFKRAGTLIDWWPSTRRFRVNKQGDRHDKTGAEGVMKLLEKWGADVPATKEARG